MLDRLAARIRRDLGGYANRRRARASLSALTSHPLPEVRQVGAALEAALRGLHTDEEARVMRRIEQRRGALRRSREAVDVIDYGAGRPDARRTDAEMRSGVRSTARVAALCRASKPAFWATFLFTLVRKLEPASCVELGSCVGVSAAYQAAALHLNGKGHLTTLEGAPEIARLARETLHGLDLTRATVVTGPFHETLRPTLEAARPVDFFFNDGHHDHDAVLHYFDLALPFLSERAVVVIDDIAWSDGMQAAWATLAAHERVAAAVDLGTMGLVVLGGASAPRPAVRIPL